jgi:hypothetical protein
MLKYDTFSSVCLLESVKRKFMRKFPAVQVPYRSSIHNLVNKDKTTGMLTDRKPKFHCQVLSVEKSGDTGVQLEHKNMLTVVIHNENMVLRT